MKGKKKVLMYYSYGDRVGGPVTYINTIINSELNRKYEFVTCYQNMAAGGVNIKLLRRMINKIKSEKPDIVHVHGLQSEGFYGVLAAKIAGCKNIVTTVHGFAFDSQSSSKMKRLIYRYLVEPFTLTVSDYIYCVCEYAAKRNIMKSYVGKCQPKYIHNCVPEIQITESREDVRKKLNIGSCDIVFAISGRVTKEKGFKELAEAVKCLNQEKKYEFKLIVIGSGDYQEVFCQKLAEEITAGQVIMVGQTNKVYDYLNASDVFVFPSYHENLPIALLEAGSVGLPCIAANVGGISEIINDQKTGFLIQSKNAWEYAEKMKLFIEDSILLNEMKENIKRDVCNRFSLGEMCEKIEAIYEKCI